MLKKGNIKKRVASWLLGLAVIAILVPISSETAKAENPVEHFEFTTSMDNYAEYVDLTLQDNGKYTVKVGNKNFKNTLGEDFYEMGVSLSWCILDSESAMVDAKYVEAIASPCPTVWSAVANDVILRS